MLIPIVQLIISDEVVNSSFDNCQISAQVLATNYPPSCYQTMEGNIFQTKIFFVSNDVHNANELVFLSKKKNGGVAERARRAPALRRPPRRRSAAHMPSLTPFVNGSGVTCSSMFTAFSSGIPVISSRYIKLAVQDPTTDWAPFVILHGHSKYLQAYGTQWRIDPQWGRPGWRLEDTTYQNRPFEGEARARRDGSA
jgi:hypothetical protein